MDRGIRLAIRLPVNNLNHHRFRDKVLREENYTVLSYFNKLKNSRQKKKGKEKNELRNSRESETLRLFYIYEKGLNYDPHMCVYVYLRSPTASAAAT